MVSCGCVGLDGITKRIKKEGMKSDVKTRKYLLESPS